MSYGSYTSRQSVEIVSGDDYREAEFQIELTCSARSTPAQLYGPPENCYPAEAAEFEVDSIYAVSEDGKTLTEVSEDLLRAILGKEVLDGLIENACTQADESGEF